MEFHIDNWLDGYMEAVRAAFGARIVFIGLQGSYSRGEATEQSDIDTVLILDELSFKDLKTYRALLDALPNRDKTCGFIAGLPELRGWEKSDLFSLVSDTTPLFGSLDTLAQTIGAEDIRRAVRIGACNLYHLCAHNLLHRGRPEALIGLYKSAVFTLRAIAALQSGRYVHGHEELASLLSPEDREILEVWLDMKRGTVSPKEAFERLTETLLNRASAWIQLTGRPDASPARTLHQ